MPEFLAERLFGPLGMADTGFEVPASKLDRFTSYYRTGPAGALELVDAPGGQWSSRPAFPSGAGGLVSTVDDWHRFARMLLAGGSAGGRQLLSAGSVRQMTTDSAGTCARRLLRNHPGGTPGMRAHLVPRDRTGRRVDAGI